MGNSIRTWQMISLILAVVLIATLFELHRRTTTRIPVTATLPAGTSATSHEYLVLSPNARRVHERYSL